jgi:1,4-dihydroxy-2-naphthoyl-CoA hydrolase
MPVIWKLRPTLQQVEERGRDTMVEHLGIRITEIGDDFLRGTMPANARTVQPLRILHGGANVALAETLASIAANFCVDPTSEYCVGLEINANHVRSVKEGGTVTGTARPLHLGSTTQIWEIRLEHEGKLACISRMTAAVLKRK